MTIYYRSIDTTGHKVAGELGLGSEQAAIAHLVAAGHTPLETSLEPLALSLLDRVHAALTARTLSERDRSEMIRELSDLLQSGFPLDQALGVLVEGETNAARASLLTQIQEDIREGATLSEAMSARDVHAPAFCIGLIAAGEETGAMEETLDRLATLLAQRLEIKEKIRSALIYPAFLGLMIAATMVLILTVVIPQFEPFFADMGGSMPTSTLIVLGLGSFIGSYWWALLGATVGTVLVLKYFYDQPQIKRKVHRRLLTSKLTFDLPRKVEIGGFAWVMSIMLASDVPVPKAMAAAGSTLRNVALKEGIAEAASSIAEGDAIAASLERTGLFPGYALKLIHLGEGTGTLAKLLERIAVTYDAQVQTAIERLMAILVPAITVLMGLIVAGFIGSILTGLMSVTQLG